jgi:hypothetical protein
VCRTHDLCENKPSDRLLIITFPPPPPPDQVRRLTVSCSGVVVHFTRVVTDGLSSCYSLEPDTRARTRRSDIIIYNRVG